jgi:hypothetical protein
MNRQVGTSFLIMDWGFWVDILAWCAGSETTELWSGIGPLAEETSFGRHPGV